MNVRRAVAGGVAGTLTMLIAVAGPAWAGWMNEPIFADVTGDGRIDRVTSVRVDDMCGISVEAGLAAGGYDRPHVRSYRLPGSTPPYIYCPDMGEAVDMAGDGTVELVMAWFHGSNTGYDVLVLRGFRPHQMIDTFMNRPSVIESLDLTADGLVDIWQTTDDGHGLLTFLNTRAGTLVPGPLKVDDVTPVVSDMRFVDFDGNRRLDVLMPYVYGLSGPWSNGVLVGFDNGTVVELVGSLDSEVYWDVSVVDADRNGRPDVRTVVATGPTVGTVTTFINRGGRSFVVAPLANDDLAYAYRARPTAIKVRDNDWASRNATLSIVTPPRYGRLTTTDPRYEVVYQRTATHRLPDTFVYRLSQDRRTDTATVTVRMRD
ncbi:Ig-like domain-containing protein [Plantactinospora solaniradicis]|uniref:Ig-like domain-containing protein n=1 Tax=Plantactinospora solaniradicis TaxID=1723736 RepID=A0ABW1K8Y9_9ACTN